jgi:hypothetical protein
MSMLRNLNKKTSIQGGLAFLYYSSCLLQHFEDHQCRCAKQPSGLRINRCTNHNPGLITNRCTKQPSVSPHVFGHIIDRYYSKLLTGLATVYYHGKSTHRAGSCSSRPILGGCLLNYWISRWLGRNLWKEAVDGEWQQVTTVEP